MLASCSASHVGASGNGCLRKAFAARCRPLKSMRSNCTTRRTRIQSHTMTGQLFDQDSILKSVSGAIVSVAGCRPGPILTDSRRADVRGSWFLALRGPTYDGHDFVFDCLAKDAAGLIVSKQWLTSSHASSALLEQAVNRSVGVVAVPDTQAALAQLCTYAMGCYTNTVIAITGSCGKTTCKSMVRVV